MGHKYTREQILEGAVELALAEGVGSLTFGRLAKRMGTSDRVIVYYFPSKTTLVSDVLVEIGNQLQAVLARPSPNRRPAIDSSPRRPTACSPATRPTRSSPSTSRPAAWLRPVLQPFGDLAAALVDGWVGWLSGFFRGNPKQRRAEAEATLVLIDGVAADAPAWRARRPPTAPRKRSG